MRNSIFVKGANVHNLKNVSVEIPRDKLVVFTGLSGSGKSSLAFDTIYAESYRRFAESLSSYARQFLGQLDKPDVEYIDGLSPAISIDQKTTSRNPRSTVGTVTEIYDYLRLLYAHIGIPHCPVCGREIKAQSIDQITDRIKELPEKTRFLILSPVIRGKKGRHDKVIADAIADGFTRAKIDGELYDLTDTPELDPKKKHNIEIVVDRLVMKEGIESRLSGSLETALRLSDGIIAVENVDLPPDSPERVTVMSQHYSCEEHDISIGELTPRMFSFNNPYGACPECDGIGMKSVVSPQKVIPDLTRSLFDGAIVCNGFKSIASGTWTGELMKAVGAKHGFDIHTPLCDFSEEAMNALLYGTGDMQYPITYRSGGERKSYTAHFEGIINMISARFDMTNKEYYDSFLDEVTCPHCKGKRLKKEMLSVTVGGLNISDFCDLPVKDELKFINNLRLSEKENIIAKEILKEIRARLGFLEKVGLDYLTLSRRSGTLSGGESQRIRLATQIGSSLMGVLYVLDEPSIGLHQRDNTRLIDTLKSLRDAGNTVIVVEHDTETIENADFIVDIGPEAGINGGRLVAAGTLEDIVACPESITGQYLSGKKTIAVPGHRRQGNGKSLRVIGAAENNLKNIDVDIPLGMVVCVTGVSGSGKSSLVNGILVRELSRLLNRANTVPGKFERLEGAEALDKIISIDQSPIGRTPRSNPATYTGVFTDIRNVFAKTNDAKIRGFGPERFSFNLKGGRCENCSGDGTMKIEMHFLSDVYVTCDVCSGKRYNRETLEVKYKGKSISDVLEMSVDEAISFFDSIPSIRRKLQTLKDVGLGYIKLGQSSTTLSGGEAQRVKLSCELSRTGTGKTLYVLDEPTTGLHTEDVSKLVGIINRLAENGNTVLIIEHNLDVIKTADYIIDLGPEGGERGGTLVACGTPEEVAAVPESYTGQFLRKIFEKEKKK